MAKNSSKKVQKAARAGGKVRSGGERRNLGFPAAVALVALLGVALVVYAWGEATVDILEPQIGTHWHSAYAIYTCDEFKPNVLDTNDPLGIHTHADGLIHIHPFSSAAAGLDAKLSVFAEAAGIGLSDERLRYPGDDALVEGEATCGDDEPAIVQVAVWDSLASVEDGDDPRIITDDVGSIRFSDEGQVFTIAFAPEGADIRPPPAANLEALRGHVQTPGPIAAEDEGSTTTTTPGDDGAGDDATSSGTGDSESATTTTTGDENEETTTTDGEG